MDNEIRTINEMSTTLNDMRVVLAGVDAKLTQVVGQGSDHETRLRAVEARPDAADHEQRIRGLERTKWLMIGGAAAAGGLAGKLAGLL